MGNSVCSNATHPTTVAEMIVLEIQTRTEGSPRTAHSRKSGSGVLLWSEFFHIVLLISFLASGRFDPFFQPAWMTGILAPGAVIGEINEGYWWAIYPLMIGLAIGVFGSSRATQSIMQGGLIITVEGDEVSVPVIAFRPIGWTELRPPADRIVFTASTYSMECVYGATIRGIWKNGI